MERSEKVRQAAANLVAAHPEWKVRMAKAVEIVLAKGVQRIGDGIWEVASQSGDGAYCVTRTGVGRYACTCPDWQRHTEYCKHGHAVRIGIEMGRMSHEEWNRQRAAEQAAHLAQFPPDGSPFSPFLGPDCGRIYVGLDGMLFHASAASR